jgi:hypothetical protein
MVKFAPGKGASSAPPAPPLPKGSLAKAFPVMAAAALVAPRPKSGRHERDSPERERSPAYAEDDAEEARPVEEDAEEEARPVPVKAAPKHKGIPPSPPGPPPPKHAGVGDRRQLRSRHSNAHYEQLASDTVGEYEEIVQARCSIGIIVHALHAHLGNYTRDQSSRALQTALRALVDHHK